MHMKKIVSIFEYMGEKTLPKRFFVLILLFYICIFILFCLLYLFL